MDYTGASYSSGITLLFIPDVGSSEGQTNVVLPISSIQSSVVFDLYSAGRYPVFEIQSQAGPYRIFRFWAQYQETGY